VLSILVTNTPLRRAHDMPINNSLWASKTANSGQTESVTYDLCRKRVFGQRYPAGACTSLELVPRTGHLDSEERVFLLLEVSPLDEEQ
jgi:hypothetical protein